MAIDLFVAATLTEGKLDRYADFLGPSLVPADNHPACRLDVSPVNLELPRSGNLLTERGLDISYEVVRRWSPNSSRLKAFGAEGQDSFVSALAIFILGTVIFAVGTFYLRDLNSPRNKDAAKNVLMEDGSSAHTAIHGGGTTGGYWCRGVLTGAGFLRGASDQ